MDISADTIRFVCESAKSFEQEMDLHKAEGDKIAERTVVVVKSGIFTLSLLAVLIFVAIATFTNEMRALVSSMVQMNLLFECLSGSIDQITLAVGRIEHNTRDIQIVNSSIASIVNNMGNVQTSVQGITTNTTGIDNDIALTNHAVKIITERMGHLSDTVHRVQHNLNQLSRPIQSLNSWPMPFP